MLRRTIVGLDRADFSRRTGFDLDALAGRRPSRSIMPPACSKTTASRVRFTREGVFLADTVLCDLL